MEITGRLTKNAAVKSTKAGKEFVTFSIALNDSYKAKGSSEVTKVVTYVECSYWRSTSVAPYMTKGTIVTLSGRINVNVWTSADGEAKGQLAFMANDIKLQGGGKTGNSPSRKEEQTKPKVASVIPEDNDDLPF